MAIQILTAKLARCKVPPMLMANFALKKASRIVHAVFFMHSRASCSKINFPTTDFHYIFHRRSH
jgi:hypothetical protein